LLLFAQLSWKEEELKICSSSSFADNKMPGYFHITTFANVALAQKDCRNRQFSFLTQ
jgi:hypothetical protein